jgi:hypothetical protein
MGGQGGLVGMAQARDTGMLRRAVVPDTALHCPGTSPCGGWSAPVQKDGGYQGLSVACFSELSR